MMNRSRFRNLLTQFIKDTTREPMDYGELVAIGGSVKSVRPGRAYVKIFKGDGVSITDGFLGNVPAKEGLPVTVKYTPDGDRIINGFDYNAGESALGTKMSQGWNVGYHQHSIGSGMEYYYEARLMQEGLVHWTTGLSCYIEPFAYVWNGEQKYWAGGTFDLTSYRPPTSSQWAWVKIGINPETNAAVAVTDSAEVINPLMLSRSGLMAVDFSNYLPLAGVKLQQGAAAANVENYWTDARNWYESVSTLLRLAAGSTLTLSSDAVTITKSFHTLTSQSGTADDLATINGSVARQFVILQATASHTITVKNGTGNIFLSAGTDYSLSGNKTLMLFYNGTNWRDIGGVGAASGFVRTAPSADSDNVIQPTAGTAKALVVKGHASQSDNLLEFQNSGGSVLASVNQGGDALWNSVILQSGATTIGSDTVSVGTGYLALTSETGTSDNLATISSTPNGKLLILRAAAGHTITVKHGTGNIFFNSLTDFILTGNRALLLFCNGTNWTDIAPLGTGASGLFTGITIDNGLADGGEVSLASNGFNPWKFDNNSGTLRMFGDSRGVKLQITDGGDTSVYGTLTVNGTSSVDRSVTTAPGASVTLSETYQPTSGAGSDIATQVALNFTDDRRTGNLSNQIFRYVYTRAATATGEPSAFDAAMVFVAAINASQTAGLELLRTEGALIAGGKTLTDLRHIFIGDSGGAGTLTTQYGLYIDTLSKGGTNYAIYTADAITRIGGTFQHAGSSLGFYNTTAISKPTVTGSRGGNAALASLLTELANLGLITDGTS